MPPPALRGPHHCVGTAIAVAEMIFRYLNSRCQSGGGSLATADLEAARTHVLGSFSNGGFGFFETTHQRCMEASLGTAPVLFRRDTILASLLLACGQKAARTAFPNQITRFGDVWLGQLFGGVAQYVRQQVSPNIDERLMKAYAEAAGKLGAKLAINDLLMDNNVRRILYECVAAFATAEAPDTIAAAMSDIISDYIAVQRGIPKPDISKVTEQETRNFLTCLPPQLQLALNPRRQPAEAAAR